MQKLFEILFLIGNPGKISKGKKPFFGEYLSCYIFSTKDGRKLKFGKSSL